MRRWFWAIFALSCTALAITFAVLPIAGHNGSLANAHIADVNGDTVVNSADIHLEIDMDVTNGTGPCNPVDTVRAVTNAVQYTVAICLTSDSASTTTRQLQLQPPL